MDELRSNTNPGISAVRRTMCLISAVSISVLTLIIMVRIAVNPGLRLAQAIRIVPESGYGGLNPLIATALAMLLGSLSMASDIVSHTRARAAEFVGPLITTVYLAVAVSLVSVRLDGLLTSSIFFAGFVYFVWFFAQLINRCPARKAPTTATAPHASLRLQHRTRRGIRELARNAASCVALAVGADIVLAVGIAHNRGVALLLDAVSTAGVSLATLGYAVIAAVVFLHAESIRNEVARRIIAGAVLAPVIWVAIDTIAIVIAARLSLVGSLGFGLLVAPLAVPPMVVGVRWVSRTPTTPQASPTRAGHRRSRPGDASATAA